MTTFSALKSNRSSLQSLNEAIAKSTKSYVKEDADKFWNMSVDKALNGSAVIRFLPVGPKGAAKDLPWVKLYSHAFQGPGGWFIENCPTTNEGQKCPLCVYNTTLWNSGTESNKTIVRKQKRKLTYITNIQIITDPTKPENNGQVKLFRFGAKIFEKLQDVMNPQFPDEKAVNPFDLWEGANFMLKARNVEGYRNYDKSGFAPASPLAKTEDEMQKVWEQAEPLSTFLGADQFKSHEQLETRLNKVLGMEGPTHTTSAESVQPARVDVAPQPTKVTPNSVAQVADEDELDYFKSLANNV